MPMTLGTSIASHAAASALGAIAAAAVLSAHLAEPQSLAEYISAICARCLVPRLRRRLRTSPTMSAR
jgi:hypothetical protein